MTETTPAPRLSPTGRTILAQLARADGPMTTAELSETTGIPVLELESAMALLRVESLARFDGMRESFRQFTVTDAGRRLVGQRARTDLWTRTAVDQLLTGLGVDPRTVRHRVVVTDWHYSEGSPPQRTIRDVTDVRQDPPPSVPLVHAWDVTGTEIVCEGTVYRGTRGTTDPDEVTCGACLDRILAGTR